MLLVASKIDSDYNYYGLHIPTNEVTPGGTSDMPYSIDGAPTLLDAMTAATDIIREAEALPGMILAEAHFTPDDGEYRSSSHLVFRAPAGLYPNRIEMQADLGPMPWSGAPADGAQ